MRSFLILLVCLTLAFGFPTQNAEQSAQGQPMIPNAQAGMAANPAEQAQPNGAQRMIPNAQAANPAPAVPQQAQPFGAQPMIPNVQAVPQQAQPNAAQTIGGQTIPNAQAGMAVNPAEGERQQVQPIGAQAAAQQAQSSAAQQAQPNAAQANAQAMSQQQQQAQPMISNAPAMPQQAQPNAPAMPQQQAQPMNPNAPAMTKPNAVQTFANAPAMPQQAQPISVQSFPITQADSAQQAQPIATQPFPNTQADSAQQAQPNAAQQIQQDQPNGGQSFQAPTQEELAKHVQEMLRKAQQAQHSGVAQQNLVGQAQQAQQTQPSGEQSAPVAQQNLVGQAQQAKQAQQAQPSGEQSAPAAQQAQPNGDQSAPAAQQNQQAQQPQPNGLQSFPIDQENTIQPVLIPAPVAIPAESAAQPHIPEPNLIDPQQPFAAMHGMIGMTHAQALAMPHDFMANPMRRWNGMWISGNNRDNTYYCNYQGVSECGQIACFPMGHRFQPVEAMIQSDGSNPCSMLRSMDGRIGNADQNGHINWRAHNGQPAEQWQHVNQ